ncbi:inverse autotransporter beta domain-containing protein [Simkania sp.]|uniref:inverse autotransporter beta domain-containing protein n=1 Tax=Simkania sp. TaxID=34094 RepID=UPI003B5301D6
MNTGLGLRYLDEKVSYGFNAFYDYRNTHRYHYHQVGIGAEVFGDFWSVNVNGYFPVGRKNSHHFDQSYIAVINPSSPPYFQGHNLLQNGQVSYSFRQESAFKGFDVIGTVRVLDFSKYAIDLSGGPYYYNSHSCKSSWGSKFKLTFQMADFISISGSMSYDKVFHLRGNGEVRFTIPLGKRSSSRFKCSKKRSNSKFIDDYLIHGATRSEIIPVDTCKKKKTSSEGIAVIDPITGQPYFFWFVDNTSSSIGTFESPFSTLRAAEMASKTHDVIYVFPGDGTSTGLDQGVVLKDNQRLFGAGINHTLPTNNGTITVPAQALSNPILETSNNLRVGVVTVANDNEVAGVTINNEVKITLDEFATAVFAQEVRNVNIHDNVFNVDYDGFNNAEDGSGVL